MTQPDNTAATPDWEKKLEKLKNETTALVTDDFESLKAKNERVQKYLIQVIELLKEKHALCSNLDKQNKALIIQAESLKDITNITKDLLNIRNMEVGHLKDDMEKLQDKINQERERQKLMISKMDEAASLNDKLKTEYHTQMNLFQALKEKYELRVEALIKENVELRKKFGLPLNNNQETKVTEIQQTNGEAA